MKFRRLIFLSLLLSVGSPLFAQQLNWEQVTPPEGGEVRAIASDSRGNLVVGTVLGAFYTKDKGENWEKINNIDMSIDEIILLPSEKFLLKSLNYCFLLDNDFVAKKFITGAFSIQNNSSGVLYGVRDYYLYYSSDEGKSWKFTKTIPKLDTKHFLIYQDNHFIAAHRSGVLVSIDTGKTWTESTVKDFEYSWHLKLVKDGVGNVYLLINSNVYKSNDGGFTWTKLSFPKSNLGYQYFHSIYISKKDEIFIGSAQGILYSTDLGITWKTLAQSLDNLQSLTQTSSGELFCTSNINGVYLLDREKGILIKKNKGLHSDYIYRIYTTGDYLVAKCYDGVYYRLKSELFWKRMAENYSHSINGVDSYNRLISCDGQYIIMSSDLFNSYIKFPLPYKYQGIQKFVTPRKNFFVGIIENITRGSSYYSEVVSTSDYGKTWNTIMTYEGGYLNSSAIFSTIDGELYSGINNKLYHSKDSGKSWTLGNEFVSYVTSITSSLLDEIFVGTYEGLFKKNKSGWIDVSPPTLSNYIREVKFSKTGELFVSKSSGLFSSKDFGMTYTQLYSNSTLNGTIQNLLLSENNELYITTEKNLLKLEYEYYTPSVNSLNSAFNNFPNPFNNETIIKFSLQTKGLVNIKVFDVLGREVEEIANKEFGIGFNRVSWQPKNLPSGVYFYRIQTPTFSETKKMIYLK